MYRHTFHCILGCRHVEKADENMYSASWRPPVSYGGAGLETSGFRPVWREMSWRVSHLVWRAAFFSSPCPYVYHCIKKSLFFFYVSSLEMETNFTPRDPNTSVREGTRDPKRQTTKNIRKHCKNEGSCARFRSCEQKEKNKGIIREHAGRKITV